MALSSGQIVEATVVGAELLSAEANALIVAPMPALSSELLSRGHVVELNAGGDVPVLGTGEDALERWRQSSGATSTDIIETFRNWVADQLNLAPENFWLFRRADDAYRPQSPYAAILSQAYQPEGGVWTMLTIPDAETFVASTARLVSPEMWQQVSGRLSAIAPDDQAVLALQPRQRTLVPTQPASFANMRLIAANWLSTNVLGYAVLLAIVAVVLTLATSLLLGWGRRKR
jgi:hypothetical protein